MYKSEFRNWIYELWLENCKERFEHGQEPFPHANEYVRVYKWWLKREFKHQKSMGNV